MALDTAKNYLTLASSAKKMFLMHLMGYRMGEKVPGDRGAIGSDVMSNYEEIDRIHARHATNRDWLYMDSFWRNERR